MQENTSITRKHPRNKVKNRAMVLVNQGTEALPYHIVDLSKGGLAFRYLGEPRHYTDSMKINLYHESELIIENLPVKPVSDLCLDDNLIPLRRGSLCFESLDPEQNAKIDQYISAYAV